ncbi:hypothetical protein [Microbulbifer sp. SAOS-129_SWC]|uniref:hypothetical protein n=1 Tax=Microbulbifer sp. SAOS-129_SWC TaxID=3145235 RepID=UPI0032179568
MGYAKRAVFGVVWGFLVLGLLPPAAEADQRVSASASARITLLLPARVELLRDDGGDLQLCMAHIPARHFYLLVDSGGDDSTVRRIAVAAGRWCLPAQMMNAAAITLVAQ